MSVHKFTSLDFAWINKEPRRGAKIHWLTHAVSFCYGTGSSLENVDQETYLEVVMYTSKKRFLSSVAWNLSRKLEWMARRLRKIDDVGQIKDWIAAIAAINSLLKEVDVKTYSDVW